MRIAILGGSFDPIHEGHINIAKTALKRLRIDEVWFMPSHDTPLKAKQMAPYIARCAMVKLAIKPYRKMRLCTLEGDLKGTSYTITSVKELKRQYPQHTFCWLIGDDQAKQFAQWKDSEQLKKEIAFYVFSREHIENLEQGFYRVCMPLMNVSSTEIRQGLKWYYLAHRVRRYIGTYGLYFEQMVEARLKQHRYAHSLAVAQVCVDLAKAHGLDEVKAYRMGLLHDACKELSQEKTTIWMQHHLPEKQALAYPLWHAFVGAYELKHTFYVHDQDIYSAIQHHALGDGYATYDKLLYIADKANPLRDYDCIKQRNIAMKDLDKGFAVLKAEQAIYLKKTKVIE